MAVCASRMLGNRVCKRVQLEQLFTHYFKKVKEKRIRENFVLIYELLDEVCDYGVPQITDSFALNSYIFQKGAYEKGAMHAPRSYPCCCVVCARCHCDLGVLNMGAGADKKEAAPGVTLQVTGAVAHRNPSTFYKKNEVYLDVVETVNVLISKDGVLPHALSDCHKVSAVHGNIKSSRICRQ